MRARQQLTSPSLAGTVALLLAAGMSMLASPAQAAEPCVGIDCTVTFGYTGSQTSWAVPSNLASLSVAVAGASGTADISTFPPSPAPGGFATVELPTTLGGGTLAVLVGGAGVGSAVHTGSAQNGGGGGSYLALGDDFLVVSGGGGGGGLLDTQDPPPDFNQTFTNSVGGAGGADGPGQDGAFVFDPTAPGHGAVAATPGAPGVGYGSPYSGSAGSAASISGGVITPGVGGYAGHTSGAGGGGYAGGGGGANPLSTLEQDGSTKYEYGSGGGGSGFLAASLTAKSTGTNVGQGYITFTYQLLTSSTGDSGLAATGGGIPWQAAAAGTLLLLGGGALLASARSRRRPVAR